MWEEATECHEVRARTMTLPTVSHRVAVLYLRLLNDARLVAWPFFAGCPGMVVARGRA